MTAPASAPRPTITDSAVTPLPVGATLDRGFALLRRQPRSIVLPAVVLHALPLLAVVLLALLGVALLGDVETTTEQVRESTFFGDSTLESRKVAELTDGQWTTVWVLAGVGAVVVAWFAAAAYAAMILAARRVEVGEAPLSLRPALAEAMRAAARLFGLMLIVAVVAGVLGVVGWFVARAAFLAGGLPALGAVGVAGLALAAVVGVRLLLTPVVALVEGRGMSSFGRAWRLTVHQFWPLLGLTLLLMVVVTAVYVVVTLLLEAAFGALQAFDTVLGSWVLVPYAGLGLVLSAVCAAAFLAPLVVAHRSLAEGVPADGPVPSADRSTAGPGDARGSADVPRSARNGSA